MLILILQVFSGQLMAQQQQVQQVVMLKQPVLPYKQ
jgi:hypothetical protein